MYLLIKKSDTCSQKKWGENQAGESWISFSCPIAQITNSSGEENDSAG